MALVAYSSSSTDSEDELTIRKSVLPSAKALLGPKQILRDIEESTNCVEHEGRIRSFAHERGNWATHVYLPINCEAMQQLRDQCRNELKDVIELCPIDELHMSFSRTVVLLHHHIETFEEELKKQLSTFSSFSICFSDLKLYTNDDCTRTFVVFEVDPCFNTQLQALVRKVDAVLDSFKLPLFYNPPSFHVSLLWCLGNQRQILHDQINKFSLKIIDVHKFNAFKVHVDKIYWRCGNRYFNIPLKNI